MSHRGRGGSWSGRSQRPPGSSNVQSPVLTGTPYRNSKPGAGELSGGSSSRSARPGLHRTTSRTSHRGRSPHHGNKSYPDRHVVNGGAHYTMLMMLDLMMMKVVCILTLC